MHFRHISAKIQLKNLKQHFDWGASWAPHDYALAWSRMIKALCLLAISSIKQILLAL